MKLRSIIALLLFVAPVCLAANPKANPKAVVESGNARFTVLTPELIRIEYSNKGAFEDKATFTVQNREMSVPKYKVKNDSKFLTITTDKLTLKYRKGTCPKTGVPSPENLSITMRVNGKPVEWYIGKEDPLNLKGTCRTLDGSNGNNKLSEMENGVISRSGWAVIDDSWSNVRPDGSRSFAMEYNNEMGFDWWADRADPRAIDLYFFGYGTNYKKAVADYIKIAGKIPLPPDYVFGFWYSRYASYSADDFRQIMNEIEDNKVPADVMILDMDWHWNNNKESFSEGIGGWTGWSWNTNLIPDAKGLLDEMHRRNFKIALNLHPADGVDSLESPKFFNAMASELVGKYRSGKNIAWNLDFPDFTKSFFSNVIRERESDGVDFWWLDWQQHLVSKYTPGLGETFWCNHVFFNEMKTNRTDRRPVIFHRWGGLGSHRYQIGFSGDAFINFETLAFQPYFTATSSNVGYTYWGHDLGGHNFTSVDIVNDPELMLRWMQFGVFTPIFRAHATKDTRIERKLWKFPNFNDILEVMQLRYAMFPYLYTMARETYDTGIGMCRPLYYEYPEAEEAYKYANQYFFGNNIMVAPITSQSKNGKTTSAEIWVPEGEWWCASKNTFVSGPAVVNMDFAITEIPYFYKAGSLTPLNPTNVLSVTERPENLTLNVVAGANGSFVFYEDSGDNSDYDTVYATTTLEHKVSAKQEQIIISPRKGSDAGLATNRAWTVQVYGAAAPAAVSIDGNTLGSSEWSYDASAKCLTLALPAKPCTEKTTIVLNR